MKKIYIVLTYTGTFLSKMIKYYEKVEFTHVSLSLDSKLTKMYSFSRLNPYNPFIGGFMHEYINEGTFKRFKNTQTKIYSLKISDKQYIKMRKIIKEFSDNKRNYRFNIVGLVAFAFHKEKKARNSFYCAEFVKYVMDESGINTNLPSLVSPHHFNYIAGIESIYHGLLQEYDYKMQSSSSLDFSDRDNYVKVKN